MNTTTKEKTRFEIWSEIEAKYLGRCYMQAWDTSGKILVERIEYPAANCMVIVEKRFEKARRAKGSWESLLSVEVYSPVTNDGTWSAVEAGLEAMKTAKSAA